MSYLLISVFSSENQGRFELFYSLLLIRDAYCLITYIIIMLIYIPNWHISLKYLYLLSYLYLITEPSYHKHLILYNNYYVSYKVKINQYYKASHLFRTTHSPASRSFIKQKINTSLQNMKYLL